MQARHQANRCLRCSKKRFVDLFLCLDPSKPGVNQRRMLFLLTPLAAALVSMVIVLPYRYGPGADDDHCSIGIPIISNFVNFLTWVNVCTGGWTSWDYIGTHSCEDVTAYWTGYNASRDNMTVAASVSTSVNALDGTIGKIFYINRDEDVDLRNEMEARLGLLGISYERFPAISLDGAGDLITKYPDIAKRGVSRCLLQAYNVISSSIYGKEIVRQVSPDGFDLWVNRMQSFQKQSCYLTNGAVDGGEFYAWKQIVNLSKYEDLGMPNAFSMMFRRLCIKHKRTFEHYLSHALLADLIQQRHGGAGSEKDGRLFVVLEDDTRVPDDLQARLKTVWPFVPTDVDSLRLGHSGDTRNQDQRNKCVLHPSSPFFEPSVHGHRLSVTDLHKYYTGTFAYAVTPFEGKLARYVHHLRNHYVTTLSTIFAPGETFNHYILQYALPPSTVPSRPRRAHVCRSPPGGGGVTSVGPRCGGPRVRCVTPLPLPLLV